MFHTNLKNQRLKCGLSQKQIADYLNITPQSVSKWENGDALPSIDYLPKLAKCLNCDINAFFAPIQAKSIDSNVLYDFLVLMNDTIYTDTKTAKDVVAFENEHPSIIDTAIDFCEDLRKRKTINPKFLQNMLGCSETDARLFIEQLIVGELLEKLDIDDTYFVIKDAVRGLIILLSVHYASHKELCDPNIDFQTSFYKKIDIMKSNDEK